MESSIKHIIKIDGNSALNSIKAIKAIAPKQVEKDVNLMLENLGMKTRDWTYDEMLLTLDYIHKNYKTNEDRLSLKDGTLSGKNLREKGEIYQIMIPMQLTFE